MYKYFRNDANPITLKGKHAINFKTIDDDLKSLRRTIETRDDYISWVSEWKTANAELVKTIQYFRAMKNRVKYDTAFANSTADSCDSLQIQKKWFGKIAHALYELRKENKVHIRELVKVLEVA